MCIRDRCGVLSGALGQDKVAMKMILQDQGLPLVPWFYWWKQEPLEEAFFAKAQRLGYPMIIKPSNLEMCIRDSGSAKNNIGIDNLIEVITNKFYSSTHRGQSELCGKVFKIEY